MTSNLCHLNAFQQDNAAAHRDRETVSNYCVERNWALFIWMLRHLKSMYFYLVDYQTWKTIEERVYYTDNQTVDELK